MAVQFRGFAVFDVETTGLFPERHDRIIEIGIVRLDENLEELERWETLVDPERDLGPTRIHGITASDVKGAPKFSELIGDIWHRFECAVPVAHNLVFDRRFILAELARAGVELAQFEGICTMQLASRAGASEGHRELVKLCEFLGICPSSAHSAGHDAWMCSEVLRHLAKQIDFAHLLTPVSVPELWRRPATPLGLTRQLARARPVESRLHGVANQISSERLDNSVGAENLDQYLLILDRALDDRMVDDSEVQALIQFARDCGIDAEAVGGIHQNYLRALVSQALKDGVVTDVEERDIARVAGLLGLDRQFLDACLAETSSKSKLPQESLVGKTVCFTGELRCRLNGQLIERSQAEQLAQEAGLVPVSSVTKKLDLLVVADPDSNSGKAKKARDYGVRIITETAFWRRIGACIE